MTNYYKISAVILIASFFSSCSVKSTGSNSPTSSGGTTSTTTNVTTGGGGTTTTTTTTTTGGISCDGINNNTGATTCYYKNIPTVQAMGVLPANAGVTIWSSKNLGTSFQNNFVTDEVFNVRIVPRMAIKTNPAVNPSVAGKSCNNTLTKIATKLFVQLKLQTKEEDLAGSVNGEVATLSAAIDEPSTVWHFSKRVTPSNLVLKVVTVLSDSRCQQGGTGYCPYSDIPLNSPTIASYPTECVAFDIQFSTDTTYDLPGAAAN